jgi:hypothetical protein
MHVLNRVATRIRKLARIADELRDGADFSITRLTIVKRRGNHRLVLDD